MENIKNNLHLNNEDILFLYMTCLLELKRLEEIKETKQNTSSYPISDDGKRVLSFSYFYDNDELEELENSLYYRTVIELYNKLEPVVYLIKTTMPDLYEKMEVEFGLKEPNDTEEEEDL